MSGRRNILAQQHILATCSIKMSCKRMLQTSMHVHPQMGWAIIIPTVLFVWPLPGLLRKLKQMWLQLSVPDNSLDSNPKFFHLGLEGVVSFGHFPVSQGPRPPKTPRRPGGVLPSLALGDSSAETLCVGFSVNQAPFPFYRTLVAPW